MLRGRNFHILQEILSPQLPVGVGTEAVIGKQFQSCHFRQLRKELPHSFQLFLRIIDARNQGRADDQRTLPLQMSGFADILQNQAVGDAGVLLMLLFIKYLPMDSTGNTMREFISKRFLIEDDYTDVRFHILRLDGSRMILERGNRRWELRAY